MAVLLAQEALLDLDQQDQQPSVSVPLPVPLPVLVPSVAPVDWMFEILRQEALLAHGPPGAISFVSASISSRLCPVGDKLSLLPD